MLVIYCCVYAGSQGGHSFTMNYRFLIKREVGSGLFVVYLELSVEGREGIQVRDKNIII